MTQPDSNDEKDLNKLLAELEEDKPSEESKSITQKQIKKAPDESDAYDVEDKEYDDALEEDFFD